MMASFQIPYVPVNTKSWGPPTTTTTMTTSSPTAENGVGGVTHTPRSSSGGGGGGGGIIGGGEESAAAAAGLKVPESKFANLPYAPFGRSDRLGKSADFTMQYGSGQYGGSHHRHGGHHHQDRGGGGGYGGRDRRGRWWEDTGGKNEGFQYKAEEDEDFQLVDTTRASNTKRFVAPATRRRQQQSRLRQLNARRSAGQQNMEKENARYNQPQRTRRRANWGRGGGRFGGGGGRGHRGGWRDRVDRQASVGVRSDWTVVDEYDLSKLAKLRADVPEEQDVLWCGFLDQYNDSYDKISTKNAVPLKRSETKEFYPVTTTDDPVVEKLAIDGAGNVFITDAILSHLMACPRSVYPWDIVVQKLPDGTLFFDKRDASQFDFLTVCETANVPPSSNKSDDDPEGINTPEKLSLEATSINQNFSQQILRTGKNIIGRKSTRKNFDLPNPFFDESDSGGMEPASVAYRYRRFYFNDGTRLICRCELHGLVRKKGTGGGGSSEEQYMTAFALNEWDSKAASGGINWRDKIDTQRGAVLATELKNNSCKLAKWTAQSILSGADQMKIGFVSRLSRTNNYEHVVLATQFYRPREFASQITLSVSNMWGIIKNLVDIFGTLSEGKYVLMRDPNKAVVRLYSVPPGTFEEGDEDDEEEDGGSGVGGGGGHGGAAGSVEDVH